MITKQLISSTNPDQCANILISCKSRLMFIFLSSLIIINVAQLHHIFGEAGFDTAKARMNETFVSDRNPEGVVEAVSNGTPISTYTVAKKSDFIITKGEWTIEQLARLYPDYLEEKGFENSKKIFLIKKSIVIGKDATLNIVKLKLLLKSLSNKDNTPVIVITYGMTNIINSTVISWDPEHNRADLNPYHPRSVLLAKNGGQMNVIGSTISYLGFSQGGIHTLFSSLAALGYYNTTDFIIANSTLSNNLYGFYSDESNKFKISGNEIYGNIGYGLDPHTGSKDVIIDSNHLFTNGGQAIICSFKCSNITITNNIVEYNVEGIGLHWFTNFSTVKNNIVKYNKGYGIFIKNSSYNNIIENNTIIGNGYGIGLLEHSRDNLIKDNLLVGNILARDQIYMDKTSQTNSIGKMMLNDMPDLKR